MKKNETNQYINIPIWFIKMTSHKGTPIYLTPFERELFKLIFGLCSNNICFANDSYFADVFNVTVKHVNKSIQKLSDLGFVLILHKKYKRLISLPNRNLENGDVSICWDKDGDNIYFINSKGFVKYTFLELEKLKDDPVWFKKSIQAIPERHEPLGV